MHGDRPWIRAASVLALLFASVPCVATTYAVGSGAGCTHATLQEAINAAVANSSGPHLIKLVTGTLSVPNGAQLFSAPTDVTIEGGFSACNGAQGSGTRTVVDASGGVEGTVLDIRYFSAAPQRRITLRRLDITGGTGETGIGSSSEGGGLELRGNLLVALEETRVRANRAFRAAGILMQGGPGFTTLALDFGSAVSENIADTDGGGIWCIDSGFISVQGSSAIDFNQAGRDGGGIWLGTRCAVRIGTPVSAAIGLNTLSNNTAGVTAGGRGGGLFLQSNLVSGSPTVELYGIPSNPVFVFNNRALSGSSTWGMGGALYLEGNAAARQQVRVLDTLMINNTSEEGAAIYMLRAIDLTLRGSAARCSGLFGFGACNVVSGNSGNTLWVRDVSSSAAELAPLVFISRTRFTGNQSTSFGLIYFRVAFNTAARADIYTSIFDGNTTNGIVFTDRPVGFLDNTVVGNNFVSENFDPAVFHAFEPSIAVQREIALRGSVVWQPGTALLLTENITAPAWVATYNRCLLSADVTGLVDSGVPVLRSDPQLGADFTPAATSPALDVCDGGFFPPTQDVYGASRPIDQSGVPNTFGPYDLGAVERAAPDALFANGFE